MFGWGPFGAKQLNSEEGLGPTNGVNFRSGSVVAVSDKVGKPKATSETVVTQTSPGSRLFNSQMLLVLVGIGGAILLGLALRKRYGTGIVLVVVSPLLALGLLGLLLNLDLFAPTLR